MEKNMENDMETGGLYRDYIGIQVPKRYLYWALKSVNVSCTGLFGSPWAELPN